MRLKISLFCGLLIVSAISQASVVPSRNTIDRFLNTLGADRKADTRKTIDWGIVPGPFYTPELGVGIGVAAVGLYRPDEHQRDTPLSSLSFTGFASSTGAFGAGYENYTFLNDDRWRFYLSGDISRRPLHYWGEGFRAGRDQRGKQSYDSTKLSSAPRVLYQLANHTYAGLGWSFSYEGASSLQHKASGSFYHQNASRHIFSSGASALFSYDSRDFVENPSRGQVLNFSWTWYTPAFASDNRFNAFDAQYDTYHAINDTSLVAWEVYSRFTSGHVPWTMQSLLGDSHHLRGYYEGRYRDRNIVTSQLEWRKKLSWRHGMVVWMGAGNMSDRPGSILNGHWLPSVGAGYRFEFKKDMNIRLDYGLGQHSSGFYFQVGEAF